VIHVSAGERLAALAPNSVRPLLAQVRELGVALCGAAACKGQHAKGCAGGAVVLLQQSTRAVVSATLPAYGRGPPDKSVTPQIQGFDHQNVECSPEYIPRLREFLSTVRRAE
jgi:hypothetical protein